MTASEKMGGAGFSPPKVQGRCPADNPLRRGSDRLAPGLVALRWTSTAGLATTTDGPTKETSPSPSLSRKHVGTGPSSGLRSGFGRCNLRSGPKDVRPQFGSQDLAIRKLLDLDRDLGRHPVGLVHQKAHALLRDAERFGQLCLAARDLDGLPEEYLRVLHQRMITSVRVRGQEAGQKSPRTLVRFGAVNTSMLVS